MNTTPRRIDDELVNLALLVIGGLFLIALVLRGAGDAAALLGGTTRPTAGASAGLQVLLTPGDPADALLAPGLSAVLYWAVVAAAIVMRRRSRMPRPVNYRPI